MIRDNNYRKLDWPLIICYLLLCLIGWVSIYSSVYNEEHTSIIDLSQRYGMQFIWIISSLVIAAIIIFAVNPKVYSPLSWLAYVAALLLLVAVIFLGVEVNGSRSWFALGSVRFQPAELSKIATSLVLASLLSSYGFKLKSMEGIIKTALIIVVPVILIILQKETGSALIYAAFILAMYREGLSGWFLGMAVLAVILFLVTIASSPFYSIIILFTLAIIIRGIILKRLPVNIFVAALYLPLMLWSVKLGSGFFPDSGLDEEVWLFIAIAPAFIYHLISTILRANQKYLRYLTLGFIIAVIAAFSVEMFFDNVLKEHQRVRIENLLGLNVDLQGTGYNVHQSKIAIGSGGLTGKGFMQGTQTRFDFVPEQSTDFIFCTVGEEWGFLGSTTLILLFVFLITRIIILAEKQKEVFSRVFGYCLASVLFMHFLVNIGMTIGIMPVIGIPLPFISYGGSSLWSFTIFLFIFIRLDLDRK